MTKSRMSTSIVHAVQRPRSLMTMLAATVTVSVLQLISSPGAEAALKAAVGPKAELKPGAKSRNLVQTVDHFAGALQQLLLWVTIPFVVLGVSISGVMFMVGNRRAQSVATSVVFGLVIVATAELIAA